MTHQDIGQVEDVHGDLTTVEMDFNLAYGGYNVILTNDAQTSKSARAWLLPSAARQLIAHLQAGIAQAEAKNLDEYGHRDGDEPGPQEQGEASAAQLLARVREFMADQLGRDDMSLEEIAGQVITMVLED